MRKIASSAMVYPRARLDVGWGCPGHDRRYAIDPTWISSELGWQQRHSFEEGLAATQDSEHLQ